MGRLPVIIGCRVVPHEEYLETLERLSEKLKTLMGRPYFVCGGPDVPWPADPEADELKLAITDHYAWQSGCQTCEREGNSVRMSMPYPDREYLTLCFRAMGMRYPNTRIGQAIIDHRGDNPFVRVAFAMLDNKYHDEKAWQRIMEKNKPLLVAERMMLEADLMRVHTHIMTCPI